LKRDELAALVKPAAEANEAVVNWIKRSGVAADDIESKGEWVNFKATAKQADAMMNTNFLVYRSFDGDDAPKIRTTKVSLPRSVMDHVKMIHPTTRFTQTKAQMSQIFSTSRIEADLSAPDASCNSTITPTCLRELYNIKGVTVDPAKAGILGVAGFLKQYARFADLSKFLADSAQWASTANFTYSLVNGGVLDQNYAGSASEANLDIQYTVSLSHPMKNHFYSTGGLGQLIPDLDQPSQANNQNEPYLEFFQHLTAITDPKELPHTISFSYGEDEQSVPPSYAQTVCDMIAQLGTR
jgi:tripeptidyl-peptidase-1